MKKTFVLIVVLLLAQMLVPSSASACCKPDITVSPTSVNFGTVQVGSSSPSAVITITNDGDADLIIYTATIVGENPIHFTKVSDNATGHTLSPNESTSVSVQFKPFANGSKSAYLRIYSNSPCKSLVCVKLAGEGTGPEADLSIANSDSPDPVSAGDALTYTITITNNGPSDASEVYVFDMYPTESLTVQSTTPSKGSISQSLPQWVIDFLQQHFGISWPLPEYSFLTWDVGNMAAGTQANLVIVANVNAAIQLPIGSPIFNCAFVLGNEVDPDFSNNYVQICTNVTPPTEPDIDVDPLNINFGSVQVGTSSLPAVVTITNLGNANLNIDTITIVGVENGHFSIISDNASGQSLPPGASTSVSVQFNPTSVGLKDDASLSIHSNHPNESCIEVDLSGTGIIPPPEPGPGPWSWPGPRLGSGPSSVSEPEPETYFTVDFLGKITRELASDDGRPLKSVEAPNPDGVHLLEIDEGTRASDNNSNAVTLIVIREAEALELPDDTRLVGKAYEFKPSGTVFDKTVRLTLGYDVAQLPDNVISIGIAYYDINAGWTYLETESSIVAGIGKLTSPVDHFTVFAVLAKVAAPSPVTEPSPVPEPSPVAAPPSAPEMPAPAYFNLSNLSITPSVSRVWQTLTFIERTGEEADITVDVAYYGHQHGSYTLTLIINGITRETKEISLDPGQTRTITFTVTNNEPGSYTVQIDALKGEFLSGLWINWWLFTGFTALLILLCWLAWYLLKGRKKENN